MKKIISILILIYMLILVFYGLIIKFTLSNPLLFKIKTIVPEFILLSIIVISFMYVITYKKFKFKDKNLICIVVYLIGLVFMNIFTSPSFSGIMYTVRDLILPILTMYLLIQIDFNEKEIRYIIKSIISILTVFIIVGCLLSCVQQIKGWEWSAKFYTNYAFYGLDPISKVKIWDAHGLLRTPSVTGNSVTFGFYSLVSYILIKNSDMKLIPKIILLSMSIISMIMSTSKTVLVILVVLAILEVISKFNKYSKVSILIFMSTITSIIFAYIVQEDPGLIKSTFERFEIWKDTLIVLNPINLVVPLSLFTLNSSAEGFLSFLDNTYLYFGYATGIIGLILIIRYILNLIAKYKHNRSALELLITFILASSFLNITQGRAYFAIFCIFIPIVIKSIDINNKYNKEHI